MFGLHTNYSQKVFNLYRINPTIYFVPYLVFYLAWWSLSLSTNSLVIIFNALHLLNAGFFLTHVHMNKLRKPEVIFWGLLFLLFLLPGAYLEYPSDPWEHFRRITNWNTHKVIATYQFKARFSYFWSWSWFMWFPAETKRWAAHLLSAISQTFLCYQLLFLVRKLGFKEYWQYLAIFSFVALFGTNLFGMRYYALSPFPFAYAAYFAVLIALIDLASGKRVVWKLLVWNLIFAILNHPQTVLFLLSSSLALLIWKFVRLRSLPAIKVFLLAGVLTLIGGLLGFVIMRHFPQVLGTLDPNQISRFGVFKIWNLNLSFFQTLGIHGVIALVFAAVYFNKDSCLALLTLVPVWTLVFSPILFLTAKFHRVDTPYRILYSFPTCFMLVYAIQNVFYSFSPFRNFKKMIGLMSFAIVVFFGLLFPSPYRGRLFFQLYQASPERELKFLDPLVRWIYENRKYAASCWIISEDPTVFLIDTFLGRENYAYSRLPPLNFPDRLGTSQEMVQGFTQILSQDAKRPICGLLAGNPNLRIRIPQSLIAKYSNHWPGEYGDFNFLRRPLFSYLLPNLEIHYMWRRSTVPPFFDLYESIEKVLPPESKLIEFGIPILNSLGMNYGSTNN